MQLGISSFTYTWAIGVPGHPPDRPLTAVELLDKAAGLGLSLVQVCDNLPLDRLPPAELDAFERRAAELGIGVEVGTRGIDVGRLRTYLRLAERFQSPILRTITDTADHRPSEDEVVEILKSAMPDFEQAGIRLALENHDRFKVQTLVRILERIGSDYVGICLDTANSFGALEGPDVVVAALGRWAVNVHVKDFVVQRASHKMGFSVEGRPAGKGQLDVAWLLHTLRAQGRDLNAILELWTPPEESLATTIVKEAAWAMESVGYLRQMLP
jgi:sugar phosphate isomerase/epimerase